MRTYDQLTSGQKRDAQTVALRDLLRAIIEDGLRFNDATNHDDLQARIDAAMEKAAEMQTPWFSHEYIIETCEDDLRAMAEADAEEALYPGPDERIIRIS